ncbi:hypothetical protein OESDEN_08778 [Oesophagostomum dentatum]|uniref:Uncharacterized protein n=1 Tax=Oesophagostomum dentatum TaxID=61180 RepID=A0A0B1T7J1_OESDE|nr:hypothetical protein OESDEN_08778 [Oesophagostomum dentatum]
MLFNDVQVEDTADICRLTIPYVMPHHFEGATVQLSISVEEELPSIAALPTETGDERHKQKMHRYVPLSPAPKNKLLRMYM